MAGRHADPPAPTTPQSPGDQAAAAETAVQVEGLRVDRGARTVLPHLSMQVPAGTVTGLLGPSGSGKTTLLRAVVGVQRIKAGTVTVLGRPAGSPDLRHRIGYMTQSPSIYADLTVLQNLQYFAALYALGSTSVTEAIDAVGLSAQRHQVIHTLSGGQRSRASLACALLARPDLLVLDEPTVGQDPLLRAELWHRFTELAEAGTTILVSSHVMDEAERCQHLIMIREGAVLATGTPAQVKSRAGRDDLDEAFLALVQHEEAA